jgi:hypothetical protein
MIESLGERGNLRLAKAEERRFPGLLVQGDTPFILLGDLEDEAPDSFAASTVRDWVAAYEEMMAERGLGLPYER